MTILLEALGVLVLIAGLKMTALGLTFKWMAQF